MSKTMKAGRATTALWVTLALAACGGGDAPGGSAGAPIEDPVDAATAGSVSGMVSFSGTPPAPQPIDMREEPICADKHATPPVRERVVVGSGGGLANVFVYVKSGPAMDMRFPIPSTTPVLDQNGCIYTPHVVGVQTGQAFTVRNSDPLLHNVNASPSTNRGFNFTQNTAGQERQHTFPLAEVMIPIRCDVHGWMESFVGVVPHPYHAVTTNAGSFSLPNLPPGTYEIEAWHEVYGVLQQTIDVPVSGSAEVSFEFTEQMAGRPVPMREPMMLDYATGTLRPYEPAANGNHSHAGH